MRAEKASGLVLVEIKEAYRGYRIGDKVRLSPQDAQRYADAEMIAMTKPRKGRTAAVTSQAPETPSTPILPQALPAIPEDWLSLHSLQQVKIAEQITGSPVKAQDAKKVIQDELDRRAAAE